jgi:hypothetical protein
MVAHEVDKFDPPAACAVSNDAYSAAWKHTITTDFLNAVTRWEPWCKGEFESFLKKKLEPTSSAGDGRGTQRDEIACMGAAVCPDGTEEERFEAGLTVLRSAVEELAADIVAGKESEVVWGVFGKMDKYSYKKLSRDPPDTRSIQSPPMLYKALYLYYFGRADERWTVNCPEYEPGENAAHPLVGEDRERVLRSAAMDATDATGWDRGVPAELLHTYFMTYAPKLTVGVPDAIHEYFFATCCCSVLHLPDGRTVQKDHGMPSGFPNTIRVNSVINRVVTYIHVLGRAKQEGRTVDLYDYDQHVWSRFCGDDVLRVLDAGWEWVADELYYELASKHFPKWVLKCEGRARRADYGSLEDYLCASPGFVSRRFMFVDGQLWRVPFDLVRTCAKLLHTKSNETSEERAAVVLGTSVCMMHLLNWHRRGKLVSTYLDAFVTNFAPPQAMLDGLYELELMYGEASMAGQSDLLDLVLQAIAGVGS